MDATTCGASVRAEFIVDVVGKHFEDCWFTARDFRNVTGKELDTQAMNGLIARRVIVRTTPTKGGERIRYRMAYPERAETVRIAKYKLRPVETPPPVEALQYEPGDQAKAGWVFGWLIANGIRFEAAGQTLYVYLGEERTAVSAGEWLVRGQNGVFAVFSDGAFTAKYERARAPQGKRQQQAATA